MARVRSTHAEKLNGVRVAALWVPHAVREVIVGGTMIRSSHCTMRTHSDPYMGEMQDLPWTKTRRHFRAGRTLKSVEQHRGNNENMGRIGEVSC